jgi:hypothetical protein
MEQKFIPVILYTTAGCHLCELAEAILLQINDSIPLEITYSEIGDDDDLIAQYGTRIPVIQFSDNSQLNWPFELSDIINHLSKK